MMPQLFDKRPPFVRFEEREYGINQEASLAAGRPVPRVVILACITPHASKDVVEKPAEEWLAQIKQKAMQSQYPLEWVNFFQAQFEEWKKGNELPREGTPVATWQMLTKEQSRRLRDIGLTTVEDLAQYPDSGLGEIGMDGRYLRDMARAWIDEAKDKGLNTKALADANVKIETLEREKEALRARIERLEARLEEPAEQVKRGPGRPRKDEAA